MKQKNTEKTLQKIIDDLHEYVYKHSRTTYEAYNSPNRITSYGRCSVERNRSENS